jgi:hypothetical protein
MLGLPPALEGRGRAQGGVKSEILGPALHRPGADVAAALALRQGEAALARRLARQFVQGRIQPFGLEVGADLDLAAGLRAGLRGARLAGVLLLRLAAS